VTKLTSMIVMNLVTLKCDLSLNKPATEVSFSIIHVR